MFVLLVILIELYKMYLSANYYDNNIYLYHKPSGPILCKNNFSYKMTDTVTYNKITCLISTINHKDNIQIYNNDHISLSINSLWSLSQNPTLSQHPIVKRNILIPSIDDINLTKNHVDLNPINCLCQDNTHIINLPQITIHIQNQEYIFRNWVGNNQVWVSSNNIDMFYAYAYLYVFHSHTILLVSRTSTAAEDILLDTDISFTYKHTNSICDEYNRIECDKYYPQFSLSNLKILNAPLHQTITTNDISIDIS